MKPLVISIALMAAGVALAQDAPIAAAQPEDARMTAVEIWQAAPETVFDATEIDLDEFQWIARPVVVFADTPADPAFRQQMEFLEDRRDELIERDVVVVTDTDPNAGSEIRTRLRPRGYMMTLMGKDGGVKLRKPFPWDVRELTRTIDKMPMRQQEIRDRRRPEG